MLRGVLLVLVVCTAFVFNASTAAAESTDTLLTDRDGVTVGSADADGAGALVGTLHAFNEPLTGPDAQTREEKETVQAQSVEGEVEEYDPWESFNEPMFTFNLKIDEHVLRPIARAYDNVMPDELQQALDRAFSNLGMVRRAVNSALQLKFVGSLREVSRFVINSTIGVAGLYDAAKTEFGIEKSNEDMGQTFAVWGFPNGPYLVLPFISPTTIRDAFGMLIDFFLDPISYFIPFVAKVAMKITDIVNERSLQLEVFENVERATLDLYSAVRNAYLQRRAKAIRE
jgi:phospholipid-binding lipoprotein MlaA